MSKDKKPFKCGNCKGRHKTAEGVRKCYEKAGKIKPAPQEKIVLCPACRTALTSPTERHPCVNGEAVGPQPVPVAKPSPEFYGRGGLALPFPSGRYAIKRNGTTLFYKIEEPEEGRWAGYVFVSVQASDEFHPVKDRVAATKIIRKVADDPRKAMLRYGRELGVCGACGRTLTNEESRRRGIGPICAATTTF